MSSQSGKTKNSRYPANDALKRGSPSTIESACRKPDICADYVNLREKYQSLKNEYQKSQVKLEQMEQLKKENNSKLIQLTKKNDEIKKLQITITQKDNGIKFLKETTVNKCDIQRLEGLIKAKDREIEELKSQVDDEKPNNCATIKNLQKIVSQLKIKMSNIQEEIKFWKHKSDDFERKYNDSESSYELLKKSADSYELKLQDEIIQLRNDNKLMRQKITDLFDSL
tara:strand:- start:333 stop:1010 length:678 start_codon:yes stop_codon:yes gene_type:complete